MHTQKNALECVTCRRASASTSEGSQNLSWWRWWNQYRPWERSNLEPLDGKMMSGWKISTYLGKYLVESIQLLCSFLCLKFQPSMIVLRFPDQYQAK